MKQEIEEIEADAPDLEALEEAKEEAFATLVEDQEEMASIMTFLEAQHPNEVARLAQLRKEIPAKREALKDILRKIGQNGSCLGYDYRVQHAKTTVIDTEGILERAEERGDIHELQKFGFLEFAVNAQQLNRLPGVLKAVYKNFIRKEPSTTKVLLPPELK